MAASVQLGAQQTGKSKRMGLCVCLGARSAAGPSCPFFIAFITTPQRATAKVGEEWKGVEKGSKGRGQTSVGEPEVGSLLHSSSLLWGEKGGWFGPGCEV